MLETEQPLTVYIPLINNNDPAAQVAAVPVRLGQQVEAGAVLCSLETTKAAVDVTAERAGYIQELRVEPGMVLEAGEIICVIGATPPEEQAAGGQADNAPVPATPKDVRITRPARRLADRLGISLAQLPGDALITEAVVRAYADTARPQTAAALPALPSTLDAASVIIFGGGGHARSLIDLIRAGGAFRIAGIIDDRLPVGDTMLGVPVLGSRLELPALRARGLCLAVNAVGALSPRVQIFVDLAHQGFGFPIMVHPRAVVEPSALLSAGAQVFASAVVSSAAQVGVGVIINTGAIISHDCVVEDFAHIAPGATLAGGVRVGRGAQIGMGVTTSVGISIGDQARIGNGARLHGDVPPGAIVPSGAAWPA